MADDLSQQKIDVGVPLRIVAAQVIVEKAEPKNDPEAERNRLISSILFALLLAVITCWFTVHLKAFVTGVLLLGTVTFWSALQIFLGNLKSAVGDDAKGWWKKLLVNVWTKRVLLALVMLAPLLFVFTSSLQFKLGRDAKEVEIAIRDASGTTLQTMKLNASHSSDAWPIFAPAAPDVITLSVKSPRGYLDESMSLRAGQALPITFPDDFHRRALVRFRVSDKVKDIVSRPGDPLFERTDFYLTASGRLPISKRRSAPLLAYAGASDATVAKELIDRARNEVAGREPEAIVRDWDLVEGDFVTAMIRVDNTPLLRCSVILEGAVNDCVMEKVQ